MTFAKRVFQFAGGIGILMLFPAYFLEERIGRDMPPAINHPEYFYGFIGVALACQVLFLVISTDPQRYRPMMLVGVAEKVLFGVPTVLLVLQDRAAVTMLGPAFFDLSLGVLFVIAWWRTPTR